jgi:hypothetical protein
VVSISGSSFLGEAAYADDEIVVLADQMREHLLDAPAAVLATGRIVIVDARHGAVERNHQCAQPVANRRFGCGHGGCRS